MDITAYSATKQKVLSRSLWLFWHIPGTIKQRFWIAFAFLLLPISSFGQSAPDRLLTESFTRSLGLQWKQDGRVIELSLQNPKDKWVITEGTFIVEYSTTTIPPAASAQSEKHKTKKRTDGTRVITLDELLTNPQYFPQRQPETYKLKLDLLPNRTVMTHIELESADTVSKVKLNETRGREPTKLEQLKSAF